MYPAGVKVGFNCLSELLIVASLTDAVRDNEATVQPLEAVCDGRVFYRRGFVGYRYPHASYGYRARGCRPRPQCGVSTSPYASYFGSESIPCTRGTLRASNTVGSTSVAVRTVVT
jgi:hypothetical protein